MAAAAAPRGRAALSLAATSAGLTGWFAWRLHRAHPPNGDAGLPLWLELLLFAVGLTTALMWQHRDFRPSVPPPPPEAPGTHLPTPLRPASSVDEPTAPAAAAAAEAPAEGSALPQGARSLLAILARALGEAEVALFVRQGTRLVCRAQEPKPFGAQALGPKLASAMARPPPQTKNAVGPGRSGQRFWLLGPEPASRSRRMAVPLHSGRDAPLKEGHGPGDLGPWAVLVAQRRTGVLSEADHVLVSSVAEQIAVSLSLEQALRLAQADRLRLEHMATTDGLTELANRRHFMRIFALQLARAKRYTRKLSLIFLDIDHFKAVNDTFGHATGDEVLRGVAQVLRHTARKTDTVARYGGEEFAILMEETGPKGAQRIAERIQEALKNQPFGPEEALFYKTVSVGVACFPEHGDEPERLIACADEALYQAKRNGRDQITLYCGPP